MDIRSFVLEKAREAKGGARSLGKASSAVKDRALERMAEALKAGASVLIAENKKDIEYAKSKGLSGAMLDRLTLTEKRVSEMAAGLIEVAALPDPVGEVLRIRQRPNGMAVGRMRVPIGVI